MDGEVSPTCCIRPPSPLGTHLTVSCPVRCLKSLFYHRAHGDARPVPDPGLCLSHEPEFLAVGTFLSSMELEHPRGATKNVLPEGRWAPTGVTGRQPTFIKPSPRWPGPTARGEGCATRGPGSRKPQSPQPPSRQGSRPFHNVGLKSRFPEQPVRTKMDKLIINFCLDLLLLTLLKCSHQQKPEEKEGGSRSDRRRSGRGSRRKGSVSGRVKKGLWSE